MQYPFLKFIIVVALLLAGWVGLAAQEEDTPPTTEAAPSPVEQDTETDADEAGITIVEPDKPAPDPFDYESSEEISEDLSVSFPVDI